MARLIDADKLEQDLMDMAHNELMPDYFRQMCMSMAVRVSKEPIIEAEPVRHGKWVCLEAEIGLYGCSECDHRILKCKCSYCPKCGAKMDGDPE